MFIYFYNVFQRIDVLAKQGKYQEALYLAQSFYEGRAKAVVGLLGGSQKRKDLVAEKVCVHDLLA